MMLPILISLSVAPGSYFFCASAGMATSDAATAATGEAELTFVHLSTSCELAWER